MFRVVELDLPLYLASIQTAMGGAWQQFNTAISLMKLPGNKCECQDDSTGLTYIDFELGKNQGKKSHRPRTIICGGAPQEMALPNYSCQPLTQCYQTDTSF
jgi:hypothetical protein